MPQLRNAQTSDLIAEGPDAIDLVVIALQLGLDNVIFDDVGPQFSVTAAVEKAKERAQPVDTSEMEDEHVAKRFEDANASMLERQQALEGPLTEAVGSVLEQADPNAEPVSVVVQTGS